MKKISITVPMDYLALIRASEMFHGLAQDIHKELDAPITQESTAGQVAAAVLGDENIEADQPIQNTAPAAKKEIPRTDKPDPKSLDTDGIPWDARIHAASQLRVVRGNTWKLIRGIDKDLVAQVKAELLAAQTAQTATGEIVVLPASTEDASTVTPASQAFGNQQPVDPVVTPIDFAGLAAKITPRVVADPEYNKVIQDVLIEFNVEGGLPVLMGMPELIPPVDVRLDALWQG